jgi:hypothetical protein
MLFLTFSDSSLWLFYVIFLVAKLFVDKVFNFAGAGPGAART